MWGERTEIPWSDGIILKDGERVGLTFPTGKTFFATYNEKDLTITWEEDGHTHPMCDEYRWAIRRWLEN